MTISRWKVMACTLGLSLGGLAVCAGQSNDKLNAPVAPPVPSPQATDPPPIILPVATKPASVASAPETLPPLQAPTVLPPTIDVPRPLIVPVQAPAAPSVVVEPVVAEPLAPRRELLPMPKGTGVRQGYSTPLVHDPPPAAPDPVVPPIRVAPPVPTPPAPPVPPVDPPATEIPMRIPPAPPIIPPPIIQSPLVPPPAPMAPVSKLKMLMRLGDGKPRFEIRDTGSAELVLKVYGEKIEMQSAPNDGKKSAIEGVTAVGKVRFTGPGIEGTCDQLCVLSGTGEVMLKGNVMLRTKRGKTWSEMSAEKMIYQIGTSGLSATGTSPVTPAAYRP